MQEDVQEVNHLLHSRVEDDVVDLVVNHVHETQDVEAHGRHDAGRVVAQMHVGELGVIV